MNVLGVIIDDKLSFKPHLEQRVMRNVASSIYALKVLRSKGLEGQRLWDVTRQTLMTRMLYASPVLVGFFVDDRASRDRLEAVVRKLKRQNFLPKGHGTLAEMCDTVDNDLFFKRAEKTTIMC